MIVRATVFHVLTLGALMVAAPAARATTMPERSPEQVAALSELVVEATVISSRVERTGGRLVTVREVRVGEVLRSALPADVVLPRVLTVVLPGGELDGLGQRVAGTPSLQVGQRYLLCLSAPFWRGARTVVGLWQGVWRVDDAGGVHAFAHDGEVPAVVPPTLVWRALRGRP